MSHDQQGVLHVVYGDATVLTRMPNCSGLIHEMICNLWTNPDHVNVFFMVGVFMLVLLLIKNIVFMQCQFGCGLIQALEIQSQVQPTLQLVSRNSHDLTNVFLNKNMSDILF